MREKKDSALARESVTGEGESCLRHQSIRSLQYTSQLPLGETVYCISSSHIFCLEARKGEERGIESRSEGGLKAAEEKEGQRFEIKGERDGEQFCSVVKCALCSSLVSVWCSECVVGKE